MASPLTLRLEPELRQRVESIAKRRKCATSVVVREAIQSFVDKEEQPGSVYDAIKDLIGIGRGGDPGRSTRSMSAEISAVHAARRTKK